MKRFLFNAALIVCGLAALVGCSLPKATDAGTVTWGAPLAHTAAHYPQIIVEDDTKTYWPIPQAVNSWEVPVTFGRCKADITCVQFVEVSTLGGNRVGLTARPISSGPETIVIQLAGNPKMTTLQTLQDVAHEFGHALGLGHDDIGVMHAAISGAYPAPNAAELSRVRSLYLR